MNIDISSPQLIFWDLDGTLIDSDALHTASMRHASLALGKTLPAQLGIPAGANAPAAYRHLFGLAPRQPLPAHYAAWYGAACDYVVSHMAGTAPLAAAVECCAWFAARGLRQGLVSNSSPAVIEASLRHLGLRGYFGHLCSGDDVSQGKPAPDVYLRALDLHGVAAASCLVFEDSRTGIAASRAAGLPVVAVTDAAELAALGDFTVSPSQPDSWRALRRRLF